MKPRHGAEPMTRDDALHSAACFAHLALAMIPAREQIRASFAGEAGAGCARAWSSDGLRGLGYGADQRKQSRLLPPGAQGNACNGRLCGAAGGANLSPSTQGGASRWLIPHRSTDRKHR